MSTAEEIQQPAAPSSPTRTEEALDRKREILTSATIEDPKPSQSVFELPCGYIDDDGSLVRDVEVHEIDGDAEDMLASNTPPHLKYGQLIAMCIKRLGQYTDRGVIAGKIVPRLTIGDRVFLLFAVRRVSLGDLHYVIEPCENRDCLDPSSKPDDPKRSVSLYTVNLCDVEVRQMPQPMIRSYIRDLQPMTGPAVRAVVHPMTGVDEGRIARFKADGNSMSIIARLDQYAGKSVALKADGTNIDQVLSTVKGMGIAVRNQLRSFFNEIEGGVDTGLELQCPLCKTEFKRELQVNADFFDPSAVKRRWSLRSAT